MADFFARKDGMSNANHSDWYVALITLGGNVVTGGLTKSAALEQQKRYEQAGKRAIVTESFQEAHGL
ncbi:hypothetical protein GCM10022421_08610 [Oceanisphaera sediminis]|uniref:Uncharacterized protein n=2 Tax=Oceanisphaera sediminis TaxID=981381 RepID=A0ABP7DGN6_9GAMM